MNLEQAGTVQSDPNSLPYNLCGIDEVIQDVVVNSLQGAGVWSLLFEFVRLPGRFGQDPPLCHEHHMFPREFLLQFSHQSGLNLLERFQLRDWHKHHDGLLTTGTLDLLCSSNV